MRLRSKFIFLVGVVVVVSYGITFYRTSTFQKELVLNQAHNQARMLFRQILLTRQWVADHNGLFFFQAPGVEPNAFLPDPTLMTDNGDTLVKRNPAMVTRELSEYADKAGFFQYRVTSLKPINKKNTPDEFERRSLKRFAEEEVFEMSSIESGPKGHVLRYIAPLIVEESCLECHAQQGYNIGDIRGGLSVSIPVERAYSSIHTNNRMLLGIAMATIFLVGAVLLYLIDVVVVRRLGILAHAMEQFPGVNGQLGSLPSGADEVGSLAEKFRDLCQRHIASQQELDRTREQVVHNEKMAAVGRLAAGVAHEINNPLSGMLNCLKAMEENPEDRDLHNRYRDLLAKGLNRVGKIVRQLLNYGRSEPLKRQQVQVDELVEECCQLLEIGLKKVDLQMDLSVTRLVAVDADAVKQVVVNLGLNAIQAMPDGGNLMVRSRDMGDRILIEVQDSGTGIDPAVLPNIFDPFFTTKEVGEGSGLGLSVTYNLVQRMGGNITVESEMGEGSCFKVELPTDTLVKNEETQLEN